MRNGVGKARKEGRKDNPKEGGKESVLTENTGIEDRGGLRGIFQKGSRKKKEGEEDID